MSNMLCKVIESQTMAVNIFWRPQTKSQLLWNHKELALMLLTLRNNGILYVN